VRMRDGCKWLGCYSVVGFIISSVESFWVQLPELFIL
jgi:hypothetical protein